MTNDDLIQELEALADEWEEKSQMREFALAANELREVLQDYEEQ